MCARQPALLITMPTYLMPQNPFIMVFLISVLSPPYQQFPSHYLAQICLSSSIQRSLTHTRTVLTVVRVPNLNSILWCAFKILKMMKIRSANILYFHSGELFGHTATTKHAFSTFYVLKLNPQMNNINSNRIGANNGITWMFKNCTSCRLRMCLHWYKLNNMNICILGLTWCYIKLIELEFSWIYINRIFTLLIYIKGVPKFAVIGNWPMKRLYLGGGLIFFYINLA